MKIPKEWTFKDKEIANEFDAHVKQQLPWYDLATSIVKVVARNYIPENGIVYDLGASTGNIGRAISDVLKSRKAHFYPIEVSKEMCEKYNGPGIIKNDDICKVQIKEFDLCIAFLVLMFIPQSQRANLIKRLRSKIKAGGAIILFDKTIPEAGYISTVMWRLTIEGKLLAGAKYEDIIKKDLSISGIQRPLSIREIPGAVECFRFGDFCGWIIEAEK